MPVEVTPVETIKEDPPVHNDVDPDDPKSKGGPNNDHDAKDMDKLQVDDELGNGPISKRKCTDVICCCIFLAFVVGMVGAAGYGYSNGNVEKLLRPFDYDGRACGYDTAVKNYPYLYWPDPTSLSNIGKTMCVSSCPQYSAAVAAGTSTPTDCVITT